MIPGEGTVSWAVCFLICYKKGKWGLDNLKLVGFELVIGKTAVGFYRQVSKQNAISICLKNYFSSFVEKTNFLKKFLLK